MKLARTHDATRENYDGEPLAEIGTLNVIGAPELTFLILVAGLLCLVLRLASSTHGWTLYTGLVLLILGSAALFALPVRGAGILMLGFAVASLCMEVLALPGFGLHAIGGGVSLLFAGVYLTGEPPGAHLAVVVPAAVAVAIITFLAGRRSWRCVRDQPFDLSPILVGRGSVVLSATGPIAYGVVSGEVWQLRGQDGHLSEGQSVRVNAETADWLVVEATDDLDTW